MAKEKAVSVWEGIRAIVDDLVPDDERRHAVRTCVDYAELLVWWTNALATPKAIEGVVIDGFSVRDPGGAESPLLIVRGRRRTKAVVTFHRSDSILQALWSLRSRILADDVNWVDDRFAERESDATPKEDGFPGLPTL